MAPSIASLTAKAQAIARFPASPPINNAISFMKDKSELLEFIREFHSLDPSCISQKDEHGMTPLFLAVSSSQLNVTRLLLQLGPNLAVLRTRETGDRVTPLMAIQDNLLATRSFLTGRKIYFKGTPCKAPIADEVEIERLLKEAIGDYGLTTCSCYLCDQGWLSQKMRALLYSTSQKIIEGMSQRIERGAFSDPQDPYLPFLPLSLREEMSSHLYLGYKTVMVFVSKVLAKEKHGAIPDVPTISRLFPPRPTVDQIFDVPAQSPEWFYRQSDGHIDNVLDCLIETAARAYEEQTDPDWIEESEHMRSCNNDYNFDLVRRKLGMWGDLS